MTVWPPGVTVTVTSPFGTAQRMFSTESSIGRPATAVTDARIGRSRDVTVLFAHASAPRAFRRFSVIASSSSGYRLAVGAGEDQVPEAPGEGDDGDRASATSQSRNSAQVAVCVHSATTSRDHSAAPGSSVSPDVSCLVRGRLRASSGAINASKRPGRDRLWPRWIKVSALPDGTRSPC